MRASSEMTTQVRVDDLKAKIKENRDEHRSLFLKAQENFRAAVIDILDARLKEARAGKKVELYIRLPEPVDYTESYDSVLEMLEWDMRNEIELDMSDFERYVLNKWEWQREFEANTMSYLAS